MSPKISVVIPSYNKVKFIESTLNSIVVQNYKNLEVIIQDGGSTDGTVDVIKKFAKRYKYISWESKKDNGQLDAINNGLKKASGDILTYINADDCYENNAFRLVSQAYLKNPNALWFAGRGIVINRNNQQIAGFSTIYKNILLNLKSYFMLLVTNYLMQPSVFITKESYKKYGPFTGTSDFVFEYDLWLKLGKISMPQVLNKTLSRFRIEENTKTKNIFDKLLTQDEFVVRKYTKNPLILKLHKLHNLGRILMIKFL